MKAFIGKRNFEEFFYLAAITTAAVVVVFLYVCLYLNHTYILDQRQVTELLAVCAGFPALFTAIAGLYLQKDDSELPRGVRLLFLGLVTGTALCFIFGTLGYLFSIVLTYAFHGLIYSMAGASILSAILSGLAVYFSAVFVFKINQRKFAALIITTLLFGFLLAAAKNNDHFWWQSSLCALGMPVNQAPIYYNFTMMLTGALVLAFGSFLKPQIDKLSKAKLLEADGPLVLAILYGITALNIFLMGIIPYGVSDTLNDIHIFFANYAFTHIGLVIIFSFLLFKKFPKTFIFQNYLILLLTAAFYYFTVSRYVLPYAISEIIVVFATIVWFTLFTRALKKLSENA